MESCFFSSVLMIETARKRRLLRSSRTRRGRLRPGCAVPRLRAVPRFLVRLMASHPHNLATAEETSDLVERPLRCRKADALRRCFADPSQAFERKRQVRAALVRDQRMDLVNDDGLHGSQRFAGARRQHQVKRLRRGDQDVRRVAEEARPLDLRSVTRSDGDLRHDERLVARGRQVRDAGQRCAQVPLHVDGQRLERRNVDDPATPLLLRDRREHQPVESPEERRQRFPATGRREDQGPIASGNRRPPELLCARRRRKRAGEPFANGRMKAGEN